MVDDMPVAVPRRRGQVLDVRCDLGRLTAREERARLVEIRTDPLSGREEAEPPEELELFDLPAAVTESKGRRERDLDVAGRQARDVLDRDEERSFLEVEVDDHVRIALALVHSDQSRAQGARAQLNVLARSARREVPLEPRREAV